MASKHSFPKASGTVAKEYCQRFPETPTMTLAKKMYAENKEVYISLEAARQAVRYHRGQHGDKNRKFIVDKSLLKPLEYKYNPFDLPESHAKSYVPFKLDQSRVLNLSDLHIPYHSVEAIDIAINYGLKKDVTAILINGDLIDMFWQSRFEKDPRARSTKEEFDAARQLLKVLRDTFPKARIIFKEGNHDERWEKWLYVKAPEIFDDAEFTLEGRLKLGELKIEIVKDKLPVAIGKLIVLHGHELQGGGGVNPARATFLKTMANVIIGHCHRTSQHTEPTFLGDVLVSTSQGCLCGLYPDFARINKWNWGFSYVEQDLPTGEYHLENLKIINGKDY